MAAPRAHVTVGTHDLRRALAAVRVHASTADDDPILNRIRVTVSPDGNLYLAATDRFSSGLAIVSIWEDRTQYGELADFDLSAQDVKDILGLFKPPKDSFADEQQLALLVTANDLTITDSSGLFPDSAKAVTLPLGQPCDYPDLQRLMAAAIRNALRKEQPIDATLWTSGRLQNRFAAAADAYSAPIEWRHTSEARAALLLKVGDSFLGLLMPMRATNDDEVISSGHLRDWIRRLPEPLPTPVAMPERLTKDAVDLNDLDHDDADPDAAYPDAAGDQ